MLFIRKKTNNFTNKFASKLGALASLLERRKITAVSQGRQRGAKLVESSRKTSTYTLIVRRLNNLFEFLSRITSLDTNGNRFPRTLHFVASLQQYRRR